MGKQIGDFRAFNQNNGIGNDSDMTETEQEAFNAKQAKQRGGAKPNGNIGMGAGLGPSVW